MKRKLQITILGFAVFSSSMFVAALIIERTAPEQAWHSPLVDLLSIQDRIPESHTPAAAEDEFEVFLEDMMFKQLKYGIALPQPPDHRSTSPAARVSSLEGTANEGSNSQFE